MGPSLAPHSAPCLLFIRSAGIFCLCDEGPCPPERRGPAPRRRVHRQGRQFHRVCQSGIRANLWLCPRRGHWQAHAGHGAPGRSPRHPEPGRTRDRRPAPAAFREPLCAQGWADRPYPLDGTLGGRPAGAPGGGTRHYRAQAHRIAAGGHLFHLGGRAGGRRPGFAVCAHPPDHRHAAACLQFLGGAARPPDRHGQLSVPRERAPSAPRNPPTGCRCPVLARHPQRADAAAHPRHPAPLGAAHGSCPPAALLAGCAAAHPGGRDGRAGAARLLRGGALLASGQRAAAVRLDPGGVRHRAHPDAQSTAADGAVRPAYAPAQPPAVSRPPENRADPGATRPDPAVAAVCGPGPLQAGERHTRPRNGRLAAAAGGAAPAGMRACLGHGGAPGR